MGYANKTDISTKSFVSIPLQDNIIEGTVIASADGLPIPDVNVKVKGKQGGTITDFDGNFLIKVQIGDILVFSYVGYKTKEITITNKTKLNIALETDTSQLDEVTVVAFGTQKKESVVAAITTVKPEELKIPASNLTTSFSGKIPGVIAFQRSGEPGADNAEFFIRGVSTFGFATSPLILIDGIESTTNDLARIEVEDIDSFSVMKDATAAALYGSRGANGVILVNTKEGEEGKVKLSLKYETSFSSNTRDIEYADPITYMNLFNEARVNEGGVLPFTQNQIDGVRNKVNPYVFPATDWLGLLFKETAVNKRLNLNVSGGGKVARYYLSTTYSHDNGILNSDDSRGVNSGISLNRIQVRSNNNIKITPTTNGKVQVYVAYDDYQGPRDGASSLFDKIRRTSPVQFPAFFEPDEANQFATQVLFGNDDGGNLNYINPYADAVSGYREYTRSKMSLQINLDQKITADLKVRFKGGYDRNSYFEIRRGYDPFYYEVQSYDKFNDTYILNWLNEDDNPEDAIGFEAADNSTVSSRLYMEFAAMYDKTFNETHNVSATLITTSTENTNDSGSNLQASLPSRNIGYAGRFTYGYDSKYFAEFNFGYNGSERFSKENRFGFFPSVGAGWTVSKENFWEPYRDVVNKFRITATYGLVGNDNIGNSSDRFFYLSEINLNDNSRNASFGEETYVTLNGVDVQRYANADITWETAEKFDLGLQIGLFNNMFDMEFHYFSDRRHDIFLPRNEIPASLGLTAQIFANSGEARSHGFEGRFNYKNQINKDLYIQANANFTYATSEFLKFDEPDYSATPWRSRVGNPIRQSYGYVAERLFIDAEDAANSPQQFGRTPNIQYGEGDIKYKDINGDGKINEADEVPIGNPTSPEINYGFGFSIGYKNWDLNMFFNGIGLTSFFINAAETSPFNQYTTGSGANQRLATNNLLKVYADNHWSRENRDLYALWPKLTSEPVQNNRVRSTWFLRDGALLRLRSLEIGYTIPKAFTRKFNVSRARLYASGNNLYTWSKFDLWDPELGGNAFNYPNQRVINLGARINF